MNFADSVNQIFHRSPPVFRLNTLLNPVPPPHPRTLPPGRPLRVRRTKRFRVQEDDPFRKRTQDLHRDICIDNK